MTGNIFIRQQPQPHHTDGEKYVFFSVNLCLKTYENMILNYVGVCFIIRVSKEITAGLSVTFTIQEHE